MPVNQGNYHTYYESVYGRDNPAGESYGWIQWKGTSVCIDLHCKCGHHGHIDEEFFYHYKCPGCGRKFAVGHNVKLIELTEEEIILGGIKEDSFKPS